MQKETTIEIEKLRANYIDVQNKQKELDNKLKLSGLSICPLAAEDQTKLNEQLTHFIPQGTRLEDYIVNPVNREQLKDDIKKLRIIPEAPKPYANISSEAERLGYNYIALAQEADKALEDPQAIGEVKKAFEIKLENVLREHLPQTLGKVWQELTLVLTTASWVLTDRPVLKLEQKGQAVSVRVTEKERYARYIYNAAERHVLGLAWFFTYYLTKKRFEEAWMLLDDPAQEMDQVSFREFVRLLETLLRLNQKLQRDFTLVIALHQEERALDTARATNGKLYLLGWKGSQQDSKEIPDIKKIVLLAPGYYPKKPESLFMKYVT